MSPFTLNFISFVVVLSEVGSITVYTLFCDRSPERLKNVVVQDRFMHYEFISIQNISMVKNLIKLRINKRYIIVLHIKIIKH